MNGKTLVILLTAVGLGLVAMTVVRGMIAQPGARSEEAQEVLVAARDYKEEEILKPDMVRLVSMAKSAVPVGTFSAYKDVEDRWVKSTMIEGDLIVERKLGPKGSPPGLVSNIPTGKRALALEVNEQSGVSGFILPGHRVDVVSFEQGDKTARVGETILQNILVLATGQTFTRPEEKSLVSRTVTLALTPEEVSIVVAAKAKGPLSLSLRGVNDHVLVPKPERKADAKVKMEDSEAAARQAQLAREVERLRSENAEVAKLKEEIKGLKNSRKVQETRLAFQPVWIYRSNGAPPREGHEAQRGAYQQTAPGPDTGVEDLSASPGILTDTDAAPMSPSEEAIRTFLGRPPDPRFPGVDVPGAQRMGPMGASQVGRTPGP